MNKNKMMIAAFAVLVSAAASARAEGGTMGNLKETSDKISSIDMNKNLGEAGNVLGGFYSGAEAKAGSEAPVVYAAQKNLQAPKQAEKDVCNAKPSKIGKLASKVKPLAASASAAAPLAQNKTTWLEDLGTVTDYVGHVGGHAVDAAVDYYNNDYGGAISNAGQAAGAALWP